jgi:hypothetical protein
MKSIVTALAIAASAAAGVTGASAIPPAVSVPAEAPPAAAGSVFADLAALGYDPDRFRPDHPGRFPYR